MWRRLLYRHDEEIHSLLELTPELLQLFIQKIVVHEKDVKWSKHAWQTVEIHHNDIGWVGGQEDESKSAPDSA